MARSAISSGKGGVSIEIEPPLEFILRQHGLFRDALLDLQPLWELVKPVAAQVEEEQFTGHGDGSWPPLAETTVSQKDRMGWPSDPLVRTGTLKDSLTNPDAAAETGPQTMTYGTDVAYAIFHQKGTSRMPARQVVPDPYRVGDRRKVEAAMVTYINRAAAETFGRI